MKGKFRIFAITFAMVMALLGGMLIAQPAHKAYADENTKHIDFTPVAIYTGNYDNGTAFLLGGTDSPNLQVTVMYKVVANTGINNIVLIPKYDRTAFSIASITVDEATSYNISVNENVFASDKYNITGTEEEADYVKIAMESATTYEGIDSENTALLTVVFNLSSSAAQGVYSFGLKLSDTNNEYNNMSKANVFLDGSSLGEQEDVQINVVASNHENEVRVLRMLDAHIAVGYNANEDEEPFYSFVYSGSAPTASQVETLNTSDPANVEYTYDGSATPVVTWYSLGYDDQLVALDSAPVNVGHYVVGVSAPKHGVYNAVAEQIRHVYITAASLTIRIDNKSSEYGEDLVTLTSDNGGHEEFLQNIILSTTATSSSNAGTYPITGVWQGSGNYNPTFVDGTYTITKKAITITALDQTFDYTGVVPTIDQTKYTVILTGTETAYVYGGSVSLNWTETANAGSWDVAPLATNSNYDITLVSGKIHIVSVGEDAEYIFSFISGDTVTYDAQSHDLLIVSEQKPSWINYIVSNNVQTNADTYTISLSVTLDEQTAANYTSGVTQFNSTVTGIINRADLTITADDKGHTYGSAPATLTPATAGIGGEVAVTFTVLNSNNEEITLTTATPVGQYTIVPSASNTNYNITLNNGTYTISKANWDLDVIAQNIKYNTNPNYTVTIGDETVTEGFTVSFKDENEDAVTFASAEDVGSYTVVVTVPADDNHNATTDSATFAVQKAALATPTVSYNGGTATWTVVTTDSDENALVDGTEVAYTIGGELIDNLTYVATQTGSFKLIISSTNNNNYESSEVTLNTVHSVTFETGTVPATMPNPQYVFNGQTATEPTAPEVTGEIFSGWKKDNVLYNFSTPVTANLTLVAQWNIVTYTLTFVYHDADAFVSHTFQADHGEVLSLTFENDAIDVVLARFNKTQDDVKGYDLNGYRYAHTDNWKVTETANETVIAESTNSVTVTGAWTFTLIYTSSAIEYTLTYMVKEDNGGYAQYGEEVSVACDAKINYATLNAVPWFRADAWFADENRLTLAPETMPAGDLTVYGAIVFNIGQGDVNGDGVVNANDIMLYRQWIVGGYTMTVVAKGSELATAKTYNSNTRYFLTKVADNNADNSDDIRDVSITRMAMVGGYYWDIDSGKNVTGQEIIRNVRATEASAIAEALEGGKKVTLTGNVSAETAISVTSSKDIYLDLGGYTLTVASFSVVSNSRSTITIKNGTIVTTAGITISAPYGNVVLENLTGYDANGLVNLAAANHSLHLDGAVKFYKGTDTTVAEPTPAAVRVEKGTHVVIEQAAEIEVAKLVVTENFVPTLDDSAVISLDILSAEVEKVEVEGNVVDNSEIDTYAKLLEAVANGGSYKLTANINCLSDIYFRKNLTLNLNGYDIVFPSWGIEVTDGAKLTINDSTNSGSISAVENCLLVTDGSELVVNGGTFASTDNFIVGTHGTAGRGGNTITINGGVFNASITSAGYVACGVYVANNDEIKILGGTFNITNGVGILARSGSTTVANGVVLNFTGNGVAGKVGDSEVVLSSGEELVLDLAAKYPGGDPEITNNSSYDVCVIADSAADINSNMSSVSKFALAADIQPSTPIAFSSNATVYGNGHKLKAEISGNGTVVFNNVYTTNISVVKSGFSGTLIFNGGVLDSDRNDGKDSDAAFYSSSNSNASFEFRNMSISANITKGIKIFNAKAVVIDNCEFDATKLTTMQGGSNSSIQSLSLVDIQLQNEGANITITDSKFIGAPQGSIAVPSSVYGFGEMTDSDTGAAIKLKVEKGAQFGTVTITGNTFTNNYRDIVVGTGAYVNQLQSSATSASNGRSGDGLQYNTIEGWTIENNTTTLTSGVVASRGVATLSYIGGPSPFDKYTTRVGNVGEIVGGVAIWNIGKVLEKIDGRWYYVENGSVYAVSDNAGKAVLTAEQYYLINDLADLEAFRNEVNAGNNFAGKTIVLNADITLTSGWTPIGEGSRKVGNEAIAITGYPTYFRGEFDGNGYTISGLTTDGFIPSANRIVSGQYAYGLFALVGDGAYIHDLTLADVNIDTTTVNSNAIGDSVGALVGYSIGNLRIENITVSGSVKASESVGGIIGRSICDNASVSGSQTIIVNNCQNYATVTAYGSDDNAVKASGILGYTAIYANTTGSIVLTNNTNNGAVSATNTYAGNNTHKVIVSGIACYGQATANSQTGSVQITNNTNKATVSGSSAVVWTDPIAKLSYNDFATGNKTISDNTVIE